MIEFREIKEKQEREFAQHEEAWQGRLWPVLVTALVLQGPEH